MSPDQYGFISTKHLCRIELYRSEPTAYYHPRTSVQRALRTVRPHRRARVADEERHRYLPSWLARRIYRLLIKLPAPPLERAQAVDLPLPGRFEPPSGRTRPLHR